MHDENQDILNLQGTTPFVSLARRRGHGGTKNYNFSLFCWNHIKTIFHLK
ncbi:hypothetical protein [Lactobacillus intestinalis]|nr:hypothetical protein [Lactobacillus intestinalis]UTW40067.1 hypothetical protein KBW87_06695 [Lactobacillus intestinalis]